MQTRLVIGLSCPLVLTTCSTTSMQGSAITTSALRPAPKNAIARPLTEPDDYASAVATVEIYKRALRHHEALKVGEAAEVKRQLLDLDCREVDHVVEVAVVHNERGELIERFGAQARNTTSKGRELKLKLAQIWLCAFDRHGVLSVSVSCCVAALSVCVKSPSGSNGPDGPGDQAWAQRPNTAYVLSVAIGLTITLRNQELRCCP